MLHVVREIHRQKRGSYGSRRIARELRRRGYDVAVTRPEAWMRDAGGGCRGTAAASVVPYARQ
ncbi:IS3 family transposase [Halomonas sp. LR3S48]|uniref:IS3 family transposase n=1 Tax=Halomonas sp. LR3S48 TaxID=2982694 RepID=UPI00398E4340